MTQFIGVLILINIYIFRPIQSTNLNMELKMSKLVTLRNKVKNGMVTQSKENTLSSNLMVP